MFTKSAKKISPLTRLTYSLDRDVNHPVNKAALFYERKSAFRDQKRRNAMHTCPNRLTRLVCILTAKQIIIYALLHDIAEILETEKSDVAWARLERRRFIETRHEHQCILRRIV